ncbi:MAG: phycobilisome rod-core linker polypeptide CpcG [Aphanocapsa feldmannii 288cV]|nr:MAG: phycobilisome rod-core linker polypeptide CpcG [Aphanocapsa feldmannii 288cV]
MAIPLLKYALETQNARIPGYEVGGDEEARIFTTDQVLDDGDMDALIEASYRQIFFHAFKSDRDRFLESQLRNGQITVRDFIRGLLLSDTFRRAFYRFNSNYQVVTQVVQRVLGRDVHGQAERIAWSIVIANQGLDAFVDVLLDSSEYLDNFGYSTVPYQRRRVLPGRDLGETPFNIKSPRYEAYWRGIAGFPRPIYVGAPKKVPARAARVRGGNPKDYVTWVSAMSTRTVGGGSANTAFNYLAKVPYRKV